MINIGFSGTRCEISNEQVNAISKIIDSFSKVIGHHGDCVGGDETFHKILSKRKILTIIHPPINPKLRAFCKSEIILDEKEYIERNHDIVLSVDLMIICPKEFEEIDRSGTWATYRFSKKKKKRIILIYPDGSIQTHETNGKKILQETSLAIFD